MDWQILNDPRGQWHPNRKAGQFTHYGDQLKLLVEYVSENEQFHLSSYAKKWFFYMREYDGYIDGATRNTLENMRARSPLPCGFGSEDLSVVGRIGPLLQFGDTEPRFLEIVDLFTRTTHFTEITRACACFCAQLIWRLREGTTLDDALADSVAQSPTWIQEMVRNVQSALNDAPVDAILRFGPDCNARKAMPGALYLLLRYRSDYKTAMIENAKAGGDSAARGMVSGMLMAAAFGPEIIPDNWRQGLQWNVN